MTLTEFDACAAPPPPLPVYLQVNVLSHSEHQVTVEARISTSTGMCPPQHEEAVSCGDFFVALGEDTGASWYYQI